MSKHNVEPAGIPKMLRKQLKAKKNVERDNNGEVSEENTLDRICTKAVDSTEVTLTIVMDDRNGRLMASDGESNFMILNAGEIEVGEMWKCRLLGAYPENSAYLIEYVGMSELESQGEVPTEVVAEESVERDLPDIGANTETAPVRKDSSIEGESELVRDLRKQLKDANTRNSRLEKELKDLPNLKLRISKQDEAIRNYKVQVKSLESKDNVRKLDNAVSELERYKADCEAKDKEITKLRSILDTYAISGKEDFQKMFITGDTSLYSTMFDCMRYKVYFSPGKKTLRFIPDESGSVTVNDRSVTIPALAGYSNFLKVRSLEVEKDGSEILISLV